MSVRIGDTVIAIGPKQYYTKEEIDAILGDISTLLNVINGEVVDSTDLLYEVKDL